MHVKNGRSVAQLCNTLFKQTSVMQNCLFNLFTVPVNQRCSVLFINRYAMKRKRTSVAPEDVAAAEPAPVGERSTFQSINQSIN